MEGDDGICAPTCLLPRKEEENSDEEPRRDVVERPGGINLPYRLKCGVVPVRWLIWRQG